MAIITQKPLFGWKEIHEWGDFERLKLVLNTLPDEPLMQHLEKHRKQGRDEYPVRAMWNSSLAGLVYQHRSIEGLRRKLSRNEAVIELYGAVIIAVIPICTAHRW